MESKDSGRMLMIRLDFLSDNFKKLKVFRKQALLKKKTNIDTKNKRHSMVSNCFNPASDQRKHG